MPLRALRSIATICCLVAVAPVASAESPISLRKSWTGRVDYFATGNTMAVKTSATTKRFSQPASVLVGPGHIPDGATPLAVLLYWAGSVNWSDCTGVTTDKDVDLIPPGWTRAPAQIRADQCFCAPGASLYEVQNCRADVTTLVRENGGGLTGTWTVDGFAARISPTTSSAGESSTENASFSLVLVYAEPHLQPRSVAIYDGLSVIYGPAPENRPSMTFTLGGLRIDDPPEGDLTLYALAGTPNTTGDSVTVVGKPGNKSLALHDDDNPIGDVMNGTNTTVSPSVTGLMETDIDRFNIDAALSPDDQSVDMTYTSSTGSGGSDKYWLAYNIVGVNVYQADLSSGSSYVWTLVHDLNGDGQPGPGDTVRYALGLRNDGSGAGTVRVESAIPTAAAVWNPAEIGNATNASTADRFVLEDLHIEPGIEMSVSYELVLDDVPDLTTVDSAATFDARPRGDTGTVNALPLVVRRDGDDDGRYDTQDNCPAAPNPAQIDNDGDGKGDACDRCPRDRTDDADRDGICEAVDNCPGAPNPTQADTDADGWGDVCDTCPADPANDPDDDGVCQDVDDCPALSNPGQEDADHDGKGDACDACPRDATNDFDGDGACESLDVCPGVANPDQLDTDRDGDGDACDACPLDENNDVDEDGVCGDVDNCPAAANTDQRDGDGDGIGDPCDACVNDAANDADEDGVCGDVDDCPDNADAQQKDRDGDGTGDACDECPGDATNTIDETGRCADEKITYVKDEGCTCGGGSTPAAAAWLVLLAFACRRRRTRAALAGALALLVACGDPPAPPGHVASRIVVEPDAITLSAGLTKKVVATGTFEDGEVEDVTKTADWQSSDDTIALVTEGEVKGVKAGTATVSVSLDGVTSTVEVTVGPAVAVSVAVDPPTLSLPRGLTQHLTARAIFSDGTERVVTEEAVWTSDDPTVVSVVEAGVVRGERFGRTVVLAQVDEARGSTRLDVGAAELARIELDTTPAEHTLPVGLSLVATATGVFTDGTTQPLTALGQWSSSDATVADVSMSEATRGTVLAHSPGETRISFAFTTFEVGLDLVVTPAVVVSLEISPVEAQSPVGIKTPFTATGRFSDGSHRDVTESASWRVEDELVATIGQEAGSFGVATAIGVGTTQIGARIGTVMAQSSLVVTSAILSGIEVTTPRESIPRGGSVQLAAAAGDTAGVKTDVTQATFWASSNNAIAIVSNADGTRGLVRGLAEGPVTITARHRTFTSTRELAVTPAELSSIEVLPVGQKIRVGLRRQFTATGVFTDASRLPATAPVWTSSDDTIASVSNADGTRGLVTAHKPGEITLEAEDQGVKGWVTVVVDPNDLTAIEVDPAAASIPLGRTQLFKATGVYADGAREPFTALVTWASDDAIATVSNAPGTEGLARSVSADSTNVTARLGGIVGTATLEVRPAELVSIAVEPRNAQLSVAATLAFKATGTYTDASTHDLTSEVDWTSAKPEFATIDHTGLATGVAIGPTTIGATQGSFRDVAPLQVVPRPPTSVALTPESVSLLVAKTAPLELIATYDDASTETVTEFATWTSLDPTVATVSNTTPRGVVTGKAAGTTTIEVTYLGTKSTREVVIVAPTLLSIAVTPATVAVAKGSTTALKATGTWDNDTTSDVTAQATWTSETEATATVSAGVVTGVEGGVTKITATIGQLVATANVTVNVVCLKTLVVNEVQTGYSGAATAEWVELFNPCPIGSAPMSLTGIKVIYHSAAGTSDVSIYDFAVATAPKTVAPQGFILIASAALGLPGALPLAAATFSGSGGGIGIENASGTILDGMGYGSATNEYVETKAVTWSETTAARSLVRLPDGTDTGDNSVDFKVSTKPTPGAANALN